MNSSLPRCRVVPQPDYQTAFEIDGVERLRWHHGDRYPRPFFYPFVGPSGSSLTRLGHPGAPDHDHHRSIWFAHAKVLGIDFWSDRTASRIRQQQWLAYQDGDEAAIMAVRLAWYDGHDPKELLRQELIASVQPGIRGELVLELQTRLVPTADSLEFGQTNFGFLAVRVAKSLSAHFGGGRLTNSDGKVGEKAIFGKSARWVDYSGPVRGGVVEGITYFDHPSNPGHPPPWHVRDDGWMGASVCRRGPLTVTRSRPLVLRYLLHAHWGWVDPGRSDQLGRQFANSKPFSVQKSTDPHVRYAIVRHEV